MPPSRISEHNFHPTYRPDIDGLRALAILPVIAYHAFPHYAPAGFVGVDIFFVISGYLISLIIFKSLANNDFAFTEFYAHRIKRIFPALILVASSCYALAWFVLLPDEFKQLGKHIAAGMGFVQNFVLWKEAGYFDIASELKPLMHLWSLAVEEQFYLIYPLLVWLAWKARLNILAGVILLGIISFVLNLKGVQQDAVKTFFAPHTRFWELMVGSVLAYFYGFRAWKSSLTRRMHLGIFDHAIFQEVLANKDRGVLLASILSFIGLTLIVYSVAVYDRNMAYPGHRALAPVFGAAILILAGPQAWVNRQLLARKALVWVGLISYPLYLWHWPLLSFARIVESETPSREIRMVTVVISFILAALTYYLIEKPARYGRPTWRKITTMCALALLVGYVGYNAYSRDGLSFRIKEVVRQNAMFSIESTPWLPKNQDGRCKSAFQPVIDGYCRMAKDGDPTIQIIGDSHGNAFYPGLRDVLSDSTENVLQIGTYGCVPFRNVSTFDVRNNETVKPRCLLATGQALDIAANHSSIHTVIFWSRGPLYLSHKGFFYNDFADEKKHDRRILSVNRPSMTDSHAIWNMAMRETLDEMLSRNKRVIFVLDNAELGFDPKSCVDSRPVRLTDQVKSPCAIPRRDFDERNRDYRNLVLSVLKDYPSVRVFDAASQLCDQHWCWAMKDGKMLYKNDDHLSLDGAILMAGELMKLLH